MNENEKLILKKATDLFIQKHGELLELVGAKELFGRVFGLLMTQTEPISLKEIANHMQCSKAAVSSIMKMGKQAGYFHKHYNSDYPREDFWYFDLNNLENIDDPIVKNFIRIIDALKKNSLQVLEKYVSENEVDEEFKEHYNRISFIVESYQIYMDEALIMYEIVKKRIKDLREKYKEENRL